MAPRHGGRLLHGKLRLGKSGEGVLYRDHDQHRAQRPWAADDHGTRRSPGDELLLWPVPLHLWEDHHARKIPRAAGEGGSAHQASYGAGTLARVLDAWRRISDRSVAAVR